MRKISAMSLLIVAVLLLGGIWRFTTPPASAQLTSPGAGLQQLAGTYWLLFEFGEDFVPAIVQLSTDGSAIAVDASDEGLGGLSQPDTAQIGNAKRTGPRQTTGRTIYMSYNENGFPITATVNTIISDFNDDLSGGTGAVYPRVYDLTIGENPVDPNQGTDGDPVGFLFFRLTD